MPGTASPGGLSIAPQHTTDLAGRGVFTHTDLRYYALMRLLHQMTGPQHHPQPTRRDGMPFPGAPSLGRKLILLGSIAALGLLAGCANVPQSTVLPKTEAAEMI